VDDDVAALERLRSAGREDVHEGRASDHDRHLGGKGQGQNDEEAVKEALVDMDIRGFYQKNVLSFSRGLKIGFRPEKIPGKSSGLCRFAQFKFLYPGMPPRKSIAFVANTSWSIYKFRLYLIKKLIEQGYSIYVLAPRDQYSDQFSDWPRLTFIELNKFRSKRISLLGDLQLYRELLGHYRQLRPGYIFHYTIKANIFGSLAASRIRSLSIAVITGLGYTFSGRRRLQCRRRS